MTHRQLRPLVLVVSLVLASAGCGPQTAPERTVEKPHDHSAHLFTNGGFEDGTLTGWTVTTNLNPSGGIVYPPTSIADLRLTAGGTNRTSVITGTTDSVIPYGLTTSSTLRVPRYGNNLAVVNSGGNNYNVNTLRQAMTTTNADVDPADGKVHVRFAIAPVLQNPGHSSAEQPYFWVQLYNTTKSVMLFQTFNFANQAGVPWKSDAGGVLYTDWQSFDISPGAAQLAVGDQVEIQVIAAGCAQGGHWGEVYVDAFGPSIPGLQVSATAPASVNSGSTLTYTFNYSNGGTGAAAATTIQETLPAGTTFASIDAPGASCTTPAAGGTGNVACDVGTLNPASSGSFTVTVNVTAAAGSTISNGTYQISATGVSPLIGPLVTTAVTSGVTYADLSASITDGSAAVGWGTSTIYTLVVRNDGPSTANGAGVSVPLPANVSSWTWTCAGSGGGTCGAASGSGAISQTANLPAGGQVTYTLNATVASGSGSATIATLATASVPGGVTDSDSSNNVAADYDQVGTLRTLTLTKTGTGAGQVVSSPAAISCAAGCTSDSTEFLDGTAVVLTASTAAGNRFVSWTAGPCAGSTSPVCTVNLTANTTVTVDFMAGDWLVAGSTSSGSGTISCTSPVLNGVGSTCTITPAARYRLTALTDNGSNVLGSVSGGAYTIASVTADHAVAATFTANTDSVALSGSPASPTVYGQPITFTATVTAGAPAGTPTGTVAFLLGGSPISGCTAQALSGGVATCVTSLPVGSGQSVTAAYGGDSTYPPATSSAASRTVNAASTSTALVAAPSPAGYGQSVTLTATVTVTAPGAGIPAGNVTFRDGATVLCTSALDAGGEATCTTSSLAPGAHANLNASYAGSTDHAASGPTSTSLTVSLGATTTTIAPPPSPSLFTEQVSFTATVAAVAPAPGTPGGSVTFYDGATTIAGCTALALVGGEATCSTAALAVGDHAITAVYGGSSTFATSTSPEVDHAVAQEPTTTVVESDHAPSVFGQAVTFTATVSPDHPAAGAPGGTVEFTADGVVLAGCGAVPLSGGAATCTAAALPVGTSTIVATASGNAAFIGSTSDPLSQTVSRAASAVALSAAPSPSMYGQATTLTADLSAVAPGAGVPGGTVTFRDGSTVLGTGTAAGGTATLTTAALAAGSHDLTAAYGGDAQFTGSSGAAAHTVLQGSTTLTVTADRNPTRRGRPVHFTITLSSPHATPGGTVTILDGEEVIGTAELDGGVATFTSRDLPKGTHAITVTFDGGGDFEDATGTLDGGLVVENSPPVAGSGTALAFGAGAASRATVDAASGALDLAQGTVELWVHPGWSDPEEVSGPAEILRLGGATPRLALAIAPGRNELAVTLGDVSTPVSVALDDGAWHHLALSAGADAVTVLLDGVPAGAVPGPLDTELAATTLTLGDGFLGELDEVRVWSHVRTAQQVSPARRRPVHGDEDGLVGCWRLDEGAGAEVFDASGSALDGAVEVEDGVNPFVASNAWRDREVPEDRTMAPAAAGYDVDGDPLELTITVPATVGAASADQENLELGYQAARNYLGPDAFTFQLDDGEATSQYQLALTVQRIVTCQTTSDCGGGDLCVQYVCEARQQVDFRSGGCDTGGGASALVLVALAAWAWRRRKALGLAVALCLIPAAVRAQAPEGFALQTLEPPAAGDGFLTIRDATAPGHLRPAIALVGSWARKPLVLRVNGEEVAGGEIVESQLWGFLQGSLGIGDRILLDLTAPLALAQSGKQPLADLDKVSSFSLADVRIGGRYVLVRSGGVSLAGGLDLWLPVGNKKAFSSDGAVRARPAAILGGTWRKLVYGAEAGLLFRNAKERVVTKTGTALTFGGAAAWKLGEFRVGPEVWGRWQFSGSATSPAEALLGAHWQRGAVDASVGASTRLNDAPGAAPFRVVARLVWTPAATPTATPTAAAAPPPPAPPPEPTAAPAAEPPPPPAPPPAEPTPPPPPPDRDGDGVVDEQDACPDVPGVVAADAARNGCPPTPALVKLTDQKIELLQAIRFETGKDLITADSEPILREVAAVLAAHPEMARVRVEGHTDGRGSVASNTALSDRRARAVKAWLVKVGGIDAARLEAKGYGPAQPIATNDTPEGRALNRRVEFAIVSRP